MDVALALLRRQDDGSTAMCTAEPADLSNMPLRIASVFIILLGSLLGAVLPVALSRPSSRMHVPKAFFFVLKYVGTGVIIATAWIHLLSPAVEALHDECLVDWLGDYDWAFAIGLMTVMFMFLIELLAAHASRRSFDKPAGDVEKTNGSLVTAAAAAAAATPNDNNEGERCVHNANKPAGSGPDERFIPSLPDDLSHPPGGQDHLGHARHHQQKPPNSNPPTKYDPAAESDSNEAGYSHSHSPNASFSHDSIAGQLTAIFILEFGVVFHSVFIGLALAVSSELTILLVVLVFHQTLEGLGLGSRLALVPWPAGKRWVPYALAVGYALSTPIAIAVGINVPTADYATHLLVQGIFDAISAGILLYTGLVELLAHEFMYNPHMRNSPLRVQLFAFCCVAFGAAVMAVLGNWA